MKDPDKKSHTELGYAQISDRPTCGEIWYHSLASLPNFADKRRAREDRRTIARLWEGRHRPPKNDFVVAKPMRISSSVAKSGKGRFFHDPGDQAFSARLSCPNLAAERQEMRKTLRSARH